jgi:hypothetical protein
MSTTTKRAPRTAFWLFDKTGYLSPGSISTGTHRHGDILENFYGHFSPSGYRCPQGLGKAWGKLKSYRQWLAGTFDCEKWNDDTDNPDEVQEMLDALDWWASDHDKMLPFHYLGTHPGDGADFGVWFAGIEGEDVEIFDGYPDKTPRGLWAIVNERGNTTVYEGKKELFSYV